MKFMFNGLVLSIALSISTGAIAQNKQEKILEYRQASMALIGANFGLVGAMLKGKLPWDEKMMATYANDIAAIAGTDIKRGYPEGSDGGKTRAKPSIWKNKDGFNDQLDKMKAEAEKLAEIAPSGDKKAIQGQFLATAKTCKGCHDDYKSKDYLN